MSELAVAGVEVDREKVLRSLGLDMRDPNVHAAIAVCQRYDLDPVLKHVVVVDGNPFITRDGLLHIAHASGQLDGIVLESIGDGDDEWTAKVSVYRKDMSHPFTFPGRFPKIQKTRSGNRPHPYAQEMAIKNAESHALRRAFSVAGLGVVEEIHSGGVTTVKPVVTDEAMGLREELKALLVQMDADHTDHFKTWMADQGWPDHQHDPTALLAGLEEAASCLADQERAQQIEVAVVVEESDDAPAEADEVGSSADPEPVASANPATKARKQLKGKPA